VPPAVTTEGGSLYRRARRASLYKTPRGGGAPLLYRGDIPSGGRSPAGGYTEGGFFLRPAGGGSVFFLRPQRGSRGENSSPESSNTLVWGSFRAAPGDIFPPTIGPRGFPPPVGLFGAPPHWGGVTFAPRRVFLPRPPWRPWGVSFFPGLEAPNKWVKEMGFLGGISPGFKEFCKPPQI